MLSVRDLKSEAVTAAALDIERGGALVLTGPSGAGKSRLLRAIVDLDPNTGTVTLDGVPREQVDSPEWRRRVGFVPAESGWWSDHVGDHLEDGAEAERLLGRLGLPVEALGWSVSRLSTGERHRLAIARALLLKPEFLLLDEPSAALDGAATEALEGLLDAKRAEGLGLVIVTHDTAQGARVATRHRTVRDGVLLPAEAA